MTFSLRFSALAATTALLSACIIVDRDGSVDDDGYAFDDDWSDGGAGVTGGGIGGSGGEDTGAGGDDIYCVPEEGTGETANVCDALAALDCDGQPSLAYASCVHGFEIYNPGPAEAFAACLADIEASQSCEVDPVATCVGAVYDDSCTSDFNADACLEWTNDCSAHGESLDLERCAYEMNPMRYEAMVEMVECMNATDGMCQDRYDTCFDAALTME